MYPDARFSELSRGSHVPFALAQTILGVETKVKQSSAGNDESRGSFMRYMVL